MKIFLNKCLVAYHIATKCLISNHIAERSEDHEFSSKPSSLLFKKETIILASQNALQRNLWKVTWAWWAFYAMNLSVHWCKTSSTDFFLFPQIPQSNWRKDVKSKNWKILKNPKLSQILIVISSLLQKTQKMFSFLWFRNEDGHNFFTKKLVFMNCKICENRNI